MFSQIAKYSLLTSMTLFSLSACQGTQDKPNTIKQAKQYVKITASEEKVDDAIDRFTLSFLTQQPSVSTSLNLSSQLVGHYQNTLPDYSPKGIASFQQSMRQSAKSLAQYDASQLDQRYQLHLKVNQVIAKFYSGDANFQAGYIDTWGGHLPYIVNQISGPLIDIPYLLNEQHKVSNEQDAQDYLTRLQGFSQLIYDVQASVLKDAEHGIILPKALFPNTLGYLGNFIAMPAAQHSLAISFKEKLAKSQLNAQQQQNLLQTAIATIANKIYPAIKTITVTMQQLEKKAPTNDGIWAQPNGEKFYQHAITYLADSSLTANEIHDIGLNEVARISQEMDAILKQQGLTDGSISERMASLNEREEFVYPDSDAGRQQLLDDLNKEIDAVMIKAPSLFATIPKYDVVVKRIPEVSQDGAAGGYYMAPALDGSRPGEFAINLKDMKAQPKYSLKTLTYHEAVPGHHFQISLNMEQTDNGIMRQQTSFNAFIEGWALYSEQVAMEMGMYENDPWGNLGRLQAEIYRAARLVVDTGLHAKRWDRQQAIDYFASATGTAMSDVESAIDRYMAWPGQALGYKLGMLKILALRQSAQQALGEKFDIKGFHDVILLPGARPLTLVETDIERWIKQQ